MSVTARQYPLPLPHREAMQADDFMVTDSNNEAIAWIDRWPEWPTHCLIIHGPSGSGKTHLAHVWQNKSNASFVTPDELVDSDMAVLSANQFIAIDDAERVAGDPAREKGLFHLYNILKESKGSLLLASHIPAAQWQIILPDLRSRLLASQAIPLVAPDDELLMALMIKQFGDRQLEVPADVIEFLLPRVTRTPASIRDFIAAIDHASLAEGRRITVALAKRVLEELAISC